MVDQCEFTPSSQLKFAEMTRLLMGIGDQLDLPSKRTTVEMLEPLMRKKENKEVVQECWNSKSFQKIREWCMLLSFDNPMFPLNHSLSCVCKGSWTENTGPGISAGWAASTRLVICPMIHPLHNVMSLNSKLESDIRRMIVSYSLTLLSGLGRRDTTI
jgi:hypothetical protein